MVIALLAMPFAIGAIGGSQDGSSDMIVHEWGTFLAMNGSDGVSLEGMYHEEHTLPSFVHARSRDQLRLPSVVLKGETPVIYFYSDHAQRARVEVRFPSGIWTQWYPQARIVGPQFAQAPDPSELRDGRIRWCPEIIPATAQSESVPETSADSLWKFAREVDAAYVRTPDTTRGGQGSETERFLFYRGLGRTSLPLKFSASDGGTVSLGADERFGIAHLFILRVEKDRAAYAYRPALEPGETFTEVIPRDKNLKPLAQFTLELSDDLAARLVESGLYTKEARAMVNTWKTSYFQTPGIRVLFVMPQAWTDSFIPLTITPTPKATVRVMVGRTELLSTEREKRAEDAIRGLASTDSTNRQRSFSFLREQGRYVEPILRRVLHASTDEQVKTICKQLLNSELVAELRTALKSTPADSGDLADEPVYVRAQLALLLREIGQTAEAKAEGTAVLDQLSRTPEPVFTHAEFRGYARANARAREAIGDIKAAGDWYDRFVSFGSQSMATNDCRGCHHDSGPENNAWYRTWWAGPRYASYVARGEGLEAAIERLRQQDPDHANHLRLAYLFESIGDKPQADRMWKWLDEHSVLSKTDGSRIALGPRQDSQAASD
jgi:hypothetical protein